MGPAKPSLTLLPALTDQHVLRALIGARRLTRAEIATVTGISKPTVSESVRRLTAAGLVHDTGERTSGRGRTGTYFALSDALVGIGLAMSLGQAGIVAEALDVHGRVVAREAEDATLPATPDAVADAMRRTAAQVAARTGLAARVAVVSAADPVDRSTGRVIHLPDDPFLQGDLSPAEVLADIVTGPVIVDNDVNWAARAEQQADAVNGVDDFAYLFLGAGVGCAVVSDGEVRIGNMGLAGEIAHVITYGPDGTAMPFTEVFRVLGLRQTGLAAVDVDALLARARPTGHSVAVGTSATRSGPRVEVIPALARAVSGVLAAIVAFVDPAKIIVGGPWGTDPLVLNAIVAEFAHHPRRVPIRPAAVPTEPAQVGVRARAASQLQSWVTREAASP